MLCPSSVPFLTLYSYRIQQHTTGMVFTLFTQAALPAPSQAVLGMHMEHYKPSQTTSSPALDGPVLEASLLLGRGLPAQDFVAVRVPAPLFYHGRVVVLKLGGDRNELEQLGRRRLHGLDVGLPLRQLLGHDLWGRREGVVTGEH